MIFNIIKFTVITFLIISISSCTGSGSLYTAEGVSIQGVKPIIGGTDPDDADATAKLEQIGDIDKLIGSIFKSSNGKSSDTEKSKAIKAVCKAPATATATVTVTVPDTVPDTVPATATATVPNNKQKKCYRNELQNLIMSSSDSRCGRYLNHLKSQSSDIGYTLGIASILSATLGAVANSASGAKNFAAASGAFTGISSEYQQNYLNQLSVQVISNGILVKRKELRDSIASKAKGGITEYGMYQAISDVRRYHNSCNIVSGLQTANQKTVSGVGLIKSMEIYRYLAGKTGTFTINPK